ncbi:MAG: protein phosphatase 2C domain-containing protein [Akkermansiaceae bacterium]
MKELKDGIRSLVRIDFQGNVHKQFRGTDKEKRFANEILVLKALEERGCPNVPAFIDADEETLTLITTNCGAPAPLLTQEKATALFTELEELYGIRHDDPEPRNVTYSTKMGRFCLIDFELAEILPAPASTENKSAVWRAIWQSLTEKGTGHDGNDDAALALGVCPNGTRHLSANGEELLEPEHLVLAVSDGMGGRNAGEFASRFIMSKIKHDAPTLYDALVKGQDVTALLEDLMRTTHRGLAEMMEHDEKLKGMGATLTLAWITSETLYWAHVGDSRLYFLQDGKLQQITKDDNMPWRRYFNGQLNEYQYRHHPRRSILTEVLGGRGTSVKVFPQSGSLPLKKGGRLLLCSDGLIDGLWDQSLADEFSTEGAPAEIAEKMMSRARNSATQDDTTLIVAELSPV